MTLTESHRQAQILVAGRAASATVNAWRRLIDPHNLDATSAAWIEATAEIVRRSYSASATLAEAYVDSLRYAETGKDPISFDRPTIDLEAVRTSANVTGPVALKTATARGVAVSEAAATAVVGASRSMARHVLTGGRETIISYIDADPEVIGYVRVASPKACSFCLMLVSRGAVYKTEASAEIVGMTPRLRGSQEPGKKFHDGCGCTSKPIYRDNDPELARSEELAELWSKSTQGLSGADARKAFAEALKTA